MSNPVWPNRLQPTRLPHPWDSPGKNTGVGCQFLLQCMKVKSESEVAQTPPTLSNPMDCSLPGSSIHGILQARKLERVAMPSSRGPPKPGWNLCFLHLLHRQADSLPLVSPGKPSLFITYISISEKAWRTSEPFHTVLQSFVADEDRTRFEPGW